MSLPSRTQAIKKMLKIKAQPDLAEMYSDEMECQVLVAKDGGSRVGDYEGWRGCTWTDGDTRWYPIRIPKNPGTEPEDNSGEPMTYDLAAHADGIGMTGWNWKKRVSKWVAFDFDAISGHSDKHAKKLSEDDLNSVRRAAEGIPWVTTRRSSSGRGLHLYVLLGDVPTRNHHEHAALGRAILGMMSGLAGFDFQNRADVCGGNMWVWHRKMTAENEGFKLLKQGTVLGLDDIPVNWRDHLKVVSGPRRKTTPGFLEEKDVDLFDELTGQRPHIKLDTEHKRLIDYLKDKGACWWWETDHHMLVTHTYALKEAHADLGLRGVFDTIAKGEERGADHNCFCYPLRRGAWGVRRYTPGTAEAATWNQDGAGWTTCTLNKEPDLPTAAKHLGGIENTKNGFVFREAEVALKAARSLGAVIDDLPSGLSSGRPTTISQHKDGLRIVVEFDHNPNDQADKMSGWLAEKGKWKRVLNINRESTTADVEVGNYDDTLRHVVSEGQSDAGWIVKADAGWHDEPLTHAKAALQAMGLNVKDINLVIGSSVMKPWKLVNRPFESEYPGDREWNRKAAALRVMPADHDGDFTHWKRVLAHCGEGLDLAVKDNPWCQSNSINTGGEYLMLWIASMLQHPLDPLPYLFFYGPQNSGKSILHEAIAEFIIARGVIRAGNAMRGKSDFNAELENGILCVIEEIDIAGASPKEVYNRIKDWVTSPTISIHRKGETPYDTRNTTHWIQDANDHESCPIFSGDTRITMSYVGKLDPFDMIPKKQLMMFLHRETPYFLRHILRIEIPPSNDRLNIPVVETEQKRQSSRGNRTVLESFLETQCHHVDGEMVPFAEFFEKFQSTLDEADRLYWNRNKVSRSLPPEFPSGTPKGEKNKYIGNLAWEAIKPGVAVKQPYKLMEGGALAALGGKE